MIESGPLDQPGRTPATGSGRRFGHLSDRAASGAWRALAGQRPGMAARVRFPPPAPAPEIPRKHWLNRVFCGCFARLLLTVNANGLPDSCAGLRQSGHSRRASFHSSRSSLVQWLAAADWPRLGSQHGFQNRKLFHRNQNQREYSLPRVRGSRGADLSQDGGNVFIGEFRRRDATSHRERGGRMPDHELTEPQQGRGGIMPGPLLVARAGPAKNAAVRVGYRASAAPRGTCMFFAAVLAN